MSSPLFHSVRLQLGLNTLVFGYAQKVDKWNDRRFSIQKSRTEILDTRTPLRSITVSHQVYQHASIQDGFPQQRQSAQGRLGPFNSQRKGRDIPRRRDRKYKRPNFSARMIMTPIFAPQPSKGPRSENGSVGLNSSSGHNSSVQSSVSNLRRGSVMGTKRRSTRLVPGTIIEKPWLQQKSSLRYARYMIWISLALGVSVAAASKRRLEPGTHGSLLLLI
jgi:hypothetical protein